MRVRSATTHPALRHAVMLAALLGCSSTWAAPEGFDQYTTLHVLSDLPKNDFSAAAMNARDQVVGALFHLPDPAFAGYRWSPARDRLDVVRPLHAGMPSTRLVAINDRGLAVGDGDVEGLTATGVSRALKLLPNGRRVALPHPGADDEWSTAVSVNNAGVIIGQVSQRVWEGPDYGVRWNLDGSVDRLALPARVEHINSRGDIGGAASSGSFVWDAATGALHRFDLVNMSQLRDDGTALGWAMHPTSGKGQGAVWTLAGGLELLPHPPRYPNFTCTARSMNRSGQVVGNCSDDIGRERAVTWKRIDGAWALAEVSALVKDGALPEIFTALHINDAGHILVEALAPGGEGREPLILAPVPR